MNAGVMAWLVACVVANIYWTYRTLKKPKGPRERSFMTKMVIAVWVAAPVVLALQFILPPPLGYRPDVRGSGWFLWIALVIGIPFAIGYAARTSQKIRQEEARDRIVP
jgi:drug/metabolite transporter (DMT)-like permease